MQRIFLNTDELELYNLSMMLEDVNSANIIEVKEQVSKVTNLSNRAKDHVTKLISLLKSRAGAKWLLKELLPDSSPSEYD